MFRRFILSVLVLSFLALWLRAFGVHAETKCPPPKAPSFQQGSINITFGSTVQPATGGLYCFERCVTSESQKEVLVDWNGANIIAWVSKGMPARNSISSCTDKYELVTSTAFIGISRFPKRVGYQRSEEEIKTIDKVKRFIKSTILMMLPKGKKDPTMELIKATFRSEAVKKDDSTYQYDYSWQNLATERSFLWQSETIQSNTEEPLLKMNEKEQTISFTSVHPPVYSVTVVEIYGIANWPIGRASVGMYHPSNLKD